MAEPPLVIGVDFDNTIAIYDVLMHRIALEQGLIDANVPRFKKQIRDTIRLLPGGEIEWQKLQGIVYGPRMGEAQLAEGFSEFVQLCARHVGSIRIISHKSEYANYDHTRSNLRTNALSWMEDRAFFRQDGLGLALESVYFEATRRDKLARIKQLECTHFVDDLDATFAEDSFPTEVVKILYSPQVPAVSMPGVKVISTWQDISDYLFEASS